MERFHFKLNAVLRIRKSREQEALRAVGYAQAKRAEGLALKAQILAQIEASASRKGEMFLAQKGSEATTTSAVSSSFSAGGGVINGFALEYLFKKGADTRLLQAERALVRSERSVEKALLFYAECRKRTRAVELLKEKKLRQYQKQRSLWEQKQMDEMALMRRQPTDFGGERVSEHQGMSGDELLVVEAERMDFVENSASGSGKVAVEQRRVQPTPASPFSLEGLES